MPTVRLGEANVEEKGEGGDSEEEEEEEVPAVFITKPCTKKLNKPDKKVKGIALSLEKPKKKPMPKINEVPQRKRKFLTIPYLLLRRQIYIHGPDFLFLVLHSQA